MTRQVLYISAGLLAGLIGILISQFLLYSPLLTLLPDTLARPPLILFPITSTSLAVSMVWAEIFLNNPTRHKNNRQILLKPTIRAIWVGTITGIIAAILSITVGNTTSLDGSLLKLLGWLLIGAGAGIADGYSWQFRTIEGGQKSRAQTRFCKSVVCGVGAGFLAFVASKLFFLSQAEDMIGFILLGTVLGFFLCRTAGASLCMALRAGAGFELDESNRDYPYIRTPLRFNFISPHATKGSEQRIEEGISIELPVQGIITIGSDSNSHIYVPKLPYNCAEFEINNRQVSLKSKGKACVIVDKKLLSINESKTLKHNQILTFIIPPQDENQLRINFVRFVFYDRFLDPQA